MGGIGVITNPRSRKNLRNPKLARELGYILGDKGSLEQPTDHGELLTSARRFRERGIDVLCINGGDGTMHVALTALMRVYDGQPLPKIMLLRGGTMNTIAHGLGIGGRPGELLDYVVTRYHEDEPFGTVSRAMMQVDGDKYGFLFGNGVIAHFLELYYEGGDPTPAKAVALLARGCASALVRGRLIRKLTRPWRGEVIIDGTSVGTRDWLTIGAGTVDDIGVGFRPFYKAPLHHDRFHVLAMELSGPEFVARLPTIFRARPLEHERVEDRVTQHLLLRSDEPIGYMIDGDFHRGGREVEVRVGPSVEFIIPET